MSSVTIFQCFRIPWGGWRTSCNCCIQCLLPACESCGKVPRYYGAVILVSWTIQFRSSLQHMFYKVGVFKNFAKLSGEHLWRSLFFYKVPGQRAATLWGIIGWKMLTIFANFSSIFDIWVDSECASELCYNGHS